MLVEITKKHMYRADYMDNYDCPLARAIKEQHPEFGPVFVAGDHIIDTNGDRFPFDVKQWGAKTFDKMSEGRKKKAIIYIPTPEYDQRNPVPIEYNRPVLGESFVYQAATILCSLILITLML